MVHVSLIRRVLTLSLPGTDFTGISPALTWHSSTAAHFLGRVLGFGSQTAPTFKLGVAVVHPDI